MIATGKLPKMEHRQIPSGLHDLSAAARPDLSVVAALCGFVAVAMGAFGAHAFRPLLVDLATQETWNTASQYHLIHAVVLLCIAFARPGARLGFWLIFTGIVLFSGSLYVFSLTGLKDVALAAPAGGLCLLAGWLALVFQARRTQA